MSKDKKKTRKKKSGGIFWKVFAIVLVVFCLVCAGLLYFGNDIMMDYEASSSYTKNLADEYASKLSAGDYSVLFDESAGSATQIFEGNAIESKVRELITAAGGCTAQKGFSENRSEKPVYVMMAGSTKIATLEFVKKDEKSAHGFNQYELNKVSLDVTGSYGITLLVPEGATGYLNDVAIGDQFKTGKTEEIEAGKYDLYSTAEGAKVKFSYYEVTNLLKEPTAGIRYKDGTEAAIRYDEKLEAFTTKDQTITIRAPRNMTVYVDGVNISGSEKFISKSGIEIERIQTAMKYVDGDYTMREYIVSGIRNIGTVAVSGTAFNGEDGFPSADESGTEFTFDDCIWPSDLTAYGISDQWLVDVAERYANYVMHDKNHKTGSGGKNLILSLCYKDAQVYDDFDNFWVTMAIHDKYWIENQSVDMVQFFGENLFEAKVSFEYWIEGYDHQKGNRKMYDTTVTFWYGKFNNEWKIVDWELG